MLRLLVVSLTQPVCGLAARQVSNSLIYLTDLCGQTEGYVTPTGLVDLKLQPRTWAVRARDIAAAPEPSGFAALRRWIAAASLDLRTSDNKGAMHMATQLPYSS